MNNGLHVVVGSTGALGTALVARLLGEGLSVRAIVRDASRGREILPESVEIEEANATDRDSLVGACRNAAVIYNAVYVPSALWVSLTENFIAAARESQARLVFPSNIHPYGPLQHVPAKENHPLAATSRRGQIRIQTEKLLMDAYHAGDIQVVVPRLAAFYGPHVRDSFLGVIFDEALSGKKAWWYGSLDSPYDLAYTDDAATACVLLGSMEGTVGQVWHIPGARPLTGRQFIEMVFSAAGKTPDMDVRKAWVFRLSGLVFPNARGMAEVMYEFEQPLVMDGSKFARAFPDFEYTPHEKAVEETLDWFRQR